MSPVRVKASSSTCPAAMTASACALAIGVGASTLRTPTMRRWTTNGTANSRNNPGNCFPVAIVNRDVLHQDGIPRSEGRTGETHSALNAVQNLPLPPSCQKSQNPGPFYVHAWEEIEPFVQVGHHLVGGVDWIDCLVDSFQKGFDHARSTIMAGASTRPGPSANGGAPASPPPDVPGDSPGQDRRRPPATH